MMTDNRRNKMNLNALFERWATDEGKPFKGNLIDWKAYKANPNDLGCMCAQGQVLFEAGWSPEKINSTLQSHADKAVAKVLNISRTHAVLLRVINDKQEGAPAIVLTAPEKILGPRWSEVLNFWWFMDSLTEDQWADKSFFKVSNWGRIQIDVENAASEAVPEAFIASESAWLSTGTAPWSRACALTTNEIQGADILVKNGKSFSYMPLFGFASPDDIPARPDNYGVPVI
jgi:hypothetical protein